jgi:hypothetical protein
MTPPRGLTWLHLLPADSAFQCRFGPQWLREGLQERGTPGGLKVIVDYGTDGAPSSFDGARAFVGINCTSLGDRALRAAGFTHIQRLAVLPGLDNARWFIPLGKPAISSAAFGLYTPARASARLKRLAARVAAHVRLPVWYRDQICIAQRNAPPLESEMLKLFGGSRVHIALSSGAPDGARNRKISAAAIDGSGRILAFLKLAQSELCRTLLANEASVLKKLSGFGEDGSQIAPRLLFAGQVEGTFVAAQSPLPGRASPRWTGAHQAFLRSLETRQIVPATEAELVRALPERIAALSHARPELSAALESVWPALARTSVPLTVVHGDFAPWNLRCHRGQIAAFDWEYGQTGGIPGIDQTHYFLQTGYLLENWTVDEAVGRLRAAASNGGPNRPAQVAYLVDMLTRLFAEGYDLSNDMVEWKLRVLRRLGGSTKETVLV